MPAVTAATPWFSRTIVSTLVMPVGVAEALGVADAGAVLGRPASADGLHAARAVTRAARNRARRQGVRRRSRSTATTDRRTGGTGLRAAQEHISLCGANVSSPDAGLPM